MTVASSDHGVITTIHHWHLLRVMKAENGHKDDCNDDE
jgi:hypothetical protein